MLANSNQPFNYLNEVSLTDYNNQKKCNILYLKSRKQKNIIKKKSFFLFNNFKHDSFTRSVETIKTKANIILLFNINHIKKKTILPH